MFQRDLKKKKKDLHSVHTVDLLFLANLRIHIEVKIMIGINWSFLFFF